MQVVSLRYGFCRTWWPSVPISKQFPPSFLFIPLQQEVQSLPTEDFPWHFKFWECSNLVNFAICISSPNGISVGKGACPALEILLMYAIHIHISKLLENPLMCFHFLKFIFNFLWLNCCIVSVSWLDSETVDLVASCLVYYITYRNTLAFEIFLVIGYKCLAFHICIPI